MMPKGVSRVFAMARPSRPPIEAALVREAAAQLGGCASVKARQLAEAVTRTAIEEIDMQEGLVSLLKALGASPVDRLATDEEIDTGSMIIRERVERLSARFGKRLHESAWAAEDAAIMKAIVPQLARRYVRYLK